MRLPRVCAEMVADYCSIEDKVRIACGTPSRWRLLLDAEPVRISWYEAGKFPNIVVGFFDGTESRHLELPWLVRSIEEKDWYGGFRTRSKMSQQEERVVQQWLRDAMCELFV
jgi:hypothetical protein